MRKGVPDKGSEFLMVIQLVGDIAKAYALSHINPVISGIPL